MKVIPILIASISFVTGCATEWKTVDEPTPYISAEISALSQSRRVQDLTTIMNTTGDRAESRWSDGKRKNVRKHDVMREIEDHLLGTKYYESLQESGSHIVGYNEEFGTLNEKINDHRLYLISIKPTVLLLVPIHYERPIPLPNSVYGIKEILNSPDGAVLGFHGLIEFIYSGSSVPYENEILWYAPSAGDEPKALEQNESGDYVITFRGCDLLLKQSGDRLEIDRRK
jgi:hypothetical protein